MSRVVSDNRASTRAELKHRDQSSAEGAPHAHDNSGRGGKRTRGNPRDRISGMNTGRPIAAGEFYGLRVHTPSKPTSGFLFFLDGESPSTPSASSAKERPEDDVDAHSGATTVLCTASSRRHIHLLRIHQQRTYVLSATTLYEHRS